MHYLSPWTKIVVCKKTAGIYLSSYPFPNEPQHHNGYFFRGIEPLSFCGFEIPFFWTSTGNIWIPVNESEFEVVFLKHYPELRKKILPCLNCLWYTPSSVFKGKGYCGFDDEGIMVEENDTCRNWSNQ